MPRYRVTPTTHQLRAATEGMRFKEPDRRQRERWKRSGVCIALMRQSRTRLQRLGAILVVERP